MVCGAHLCLRTSALITKMMLLANLDVHNILQETLIKNPNASD